MGLIISRFRRKETTIEILEGIDKEISRLQKNRKENQDRQKRIATSLVIYSVILYVLSAVAFFFLYFPDTWPLRLLYSLPLLAFPFLIWGLKKLLHWYFVKRIHGNDLALRDLRDRKKQILEDVMETETYKKAKEILEKFDPARFKRLESNEAVLGSGSTSPSSSTSGLHHRKPVSPRPMPSSTSTPTPRLATSQRTIGGGGGSQTPNPFANTPLRAPTPAVRAAPTPIVPVSGLQPQAAMPQPMKQQMLASAPNSPTAQMVRGQAMGRGYAPPGPPMPRSLLPRERGTMDRLMDYLVGDGPENRYALICSNCSSHNGMALKEEFEYLSFRCCYCYIYNPARRQRPMAPRLEFFTPGPSGMKPPSAQDESDEEDDDDEEEEEEEENEQKGSAAFSSSSEKKNGKSASAPSDQEVPVKAESQRKQVGGQPRTSMHAQPSAKLMQHSAVNTSVKSGMTQGNQQHSVSKPERTHQDSDTLSRASSNGSATVGGNGSQSPSSVLNLQPTGGDKSAKTAADDQPFIDDPHSSNDWEILGTNGQTAAPEQSGSLSANSEVNPDSTDRAADVEHVEKTRDHPLEQ